MEEEWRDILEFPGYSVSNTGYVRNENTDRLMVRHVNQRGIMYVSLSRGPEKYKRSVTVLVATAFVTTARPLSFDTPIHLDGNRKNNQSDNLLWRPRWYARKYHRQFHVQTPFIDRAIEEIKSGDLYKSSWDAAIVNGLLNEEVVRSIANKTYAWPTYQRFRVYV